MGNVKLPLSPDRISHTENLLLQEEIKKYSEVKKKDNKVLFVSQDSAGVAILKFILENISELKDFDFYFKPHPNEYAYIDSIPEYKALLKYKNFYVVDILEDLYSHLADAAFVLGTFSTVLIEALYFNCRIYVLNLPGSEMFDYLIEQNKFKKMDLNSKLTFN
jgi:hypothetical protein